MRIALVPRRALLILPFALGAARADDGFTSEAARQRAAEQARLREQRLARERELEARRRVDRELERRRDLTGDQIRRWEEQRQQRVWGRTVPW